MSVNAQYNGWAAASKVNFGRRYNLENDNHVAPIASLQYVYAYNNSYVENRSVAAINVQNKPNSSIFTPGLGFRFGKEYQSNSLVGECEFRVTMTYDLIRTVQVTTSSFLVGSESFIITGSQPRLAGNFGFNYGAIFDKNKTLQISYNLQLRSGYYENFLELKFRYML